METRLLTIIIIIIVLVKEFTFGPTVATQLCTYYVLHEQGKAKPQSHTVKDLISEGILGVECSNKRAGNYNQTEYDLLFFKIRLSMS